MFSNFLKILLYIILSYSLSFSQEETNSYNPAETKCATFENAHYGNKNNKLLSPIDTIVGRPNLQKSYSYNSGYFLIHYDTSGYHAVSNVDNNNNGIPDYIDSVAYYFDYAYKVYIDTIGYIIPVSDSGKGGSEQYDIYVMNIGNGDNAFYGATKKDFEIFPKENFPKFATYIYIDNDYSPKDSTINNFGDKIQTYYTTGIDGLKITSAHEFHHAIQLSYGDPQFPDYHCINEMMSCSMEYRLYPSIKDYYQFVKSLFANIDRFPFGVGDANNGYRWSIFGQYVDVNYGDKIFLRMWQMVGEGIDPYLALDKAFQEIGTNLKNVWCNIMPWLYYTGDRTIRNKYFKDAKSFPELSFFLTEKYIEPALVSDGILKSYEVRAYRCILPPQPNYSLESMNVDVIVANHDLISASKQFASNKPFTMSYCTQQQSNCNRIAGTNYYFCFDAPKGNVFDTTFYVKSNNINYVYPDPFNPMIDKEINFPAPNNAILNDNVELTVYSADMTKQFSGFYNVSFNYVVRNGIKNDRVIRIDYDKFFNLSSGVYLFSVNFQNNVIWGKFVIKK